jgi:hypothetical protein
MDSSNVMLIDHLKRIRPKQALRLALCFGLAATCTWIVWGGLFVKTNRNACRLSLSSDRTSIYVAFVDDPTRRFCSTLTKDDPFIPSNVRMRLRRGFGCELQISHPLPADLAAILIIHVRIHLLWICGAVGLLCLCRVRSKCRHGSGIAFQVIPTGNGTDKYDSRE